MDVKRARKLVDGAVERLAAELEQGRSETLKAYLAAIGRFHRYSLGNMILIAMQRPGSSRVAGFHAWRQLGRWVRKGEHGIAILAPIVRRTAREAADENASGGEEPLHQVTENTEVAASKDDRVSVPADGVVGFRAAYVFDVSQTEGKPLPEFAAVRGEAGALLERLQGFVARKRLALRTMPHLDGAQGLSTGGTILLRTGLSAAEAFSTLVHELAHEMLHRDGAARSKVVRETEAEAVAFVVCQAVGLDTNTAASDCIQLYAGSKETLMSSLARIREVAGEVLTAVLPKAEPCGGTPTALSAVGGPCPEVLVSG